MNRLIFVALATSAILRLSGCAFIDDFGRFQVLEVDGGDDGGGDGAVLPDLDCVDHMLDGATATGQATTSGADERAASCGGASAPEKIFAWTAPFTDFFRFHTTGSDFETVLSLVEDDCDGAEIECSDEQAGTYKSEIVRRLVGGERVLLVVDGRSGDSGDAVVNVEPVACPAIQLTDALLPIAHTLVGRDPYPASTCAGGDYGSRSYRFTAPADGHYSFLAKRTEAGYRPAIRVEEGPVCGGTELQCIGGGSDGSGSLGDDGRAEVLRRLSAGEDVTLVVSGYDGEGDFELDVTLTGADTCIDDAIVIDVEELPFVYDATLPQDGPHRMTTSCGQASVTDHAGSARPQPDLNLRVELPPSSWGGGCGRSCYVEVEAGFPFAASVAELDEAETCARRERACVQSNEVSFDAPPVYRRFLDIPTDGRPKLITIDRRLHAATLPPIYMPSDNEVDISLTFDCAIFCP